jgi:hypothetical protein
MKGGAPSTSCRRAVPKNQPWPSKKPHVAEEEKGLKNISIIWIDEV